MADKEAYLYHWYVIDSLSRIHLLPMAFDQLDKHDFVRSMCGRQFFGMYGHRVDQWPHPLHRSRATPCLACSRISGTTLSSSLASPQIS